MAKGVNISENLISSKKVVAHNQLVRERDSRDNPNFLKRYLDKQNNKSLVLIAAENNNTEMVDLLIKANCEINDTYITNENDTHIVKTIHRTRVHRHRYGYHSHYDSETNEYYPSSGSEDEVEEEEDILEGDRYTLTLAPIHVAVQNNNIKMVQLLIAAGANINQSITKDDHVSPLHLALNLNHCEIAKLLIASGANVNQICKTSYTDQIRKYKGAPPSTGTPLHKAVLLGQTDIVKLLIAAGADVNPKINDRQELESLIYLAVKLNNLEMVKLLSQAGASLKVGSSSSMHNILLMAAANNNKALVLYLVTEGAYITFLTEISKIQLYHDYRIGEYGDVEVYEDENGEMKSKHAKILTADDLFNWHFNRFDIKSFKDKSSYDILKILIFIGLMQNAFFEGNQALAEKLLQKGFAIHQDEYINFFEYMLEGKLLLKIPEAELTFITNKLLQITKTDTNYYQKINFIIASHIMSSNDYPDLKQKMLDSLVYSIAAKDYPGAITLKVQAFNSLLGGSGLPQHMVDLNVNTHNFDTFREIIEKLFTLKEEQYLRIFPTNGLDRFGIFGQSTRQPKRLPKTNAYQAQDDMLLTNTEKSSRRRNSF